MNHVQGPPTPEPYRGHTKPSALGVISTAPRVTFIVLVVLSCLGFATAVALWAASAVTAIHDRPNETLLMAGSIALMITLFIYYAHVFVGLYWVYKVWEWLPREQRYTRHWGGTISPLRAALFFLIPYFHYFWMFVINCGLCDAIDRMRVTYPTREPAPKGLAIAAGISQLFVPLPVGSIMWAVFMTKIEKLCREMSENVTAAPEAP
ncbi:MAG TPA: hypothetical protein VM580_06965 [Labilithrix sp.]|nr:hypothetical protein [Labilithrix sp.]